MKRLFAATACALCLAGPALASEYYIEGTAAWSTTNDLDVGPVSLETDDGYLLGFALGRALDSQFSAEVELTYSQRQYSGIPVDLNATALMLNGYYNFPIANTVGGYIGAGVGGVFVEFDGPAPFSDNDTVLGGQLLGGLTYGVSEGVTLFTEYRYQMAADADIGGLDVEYNSHNIGGGVRIAF